MPALAGLPGTDFSRQPAEPGALVNLVRRLLIEATNDESRVEPFKGRVPFEKLVVVFFPSHFRLEAGEPERGN